MLLLQQQHSSVKMEGLGVLFDCECMLMRNAVATSVVQFDAPTLIPARHQHLPTVSFSLITANVNLVKWSYNMMVSLWKWFWPWLPLKGSQGSLDHTLRTTALFGFLGGHVKVIQANSLLCLYCVHCPSRHLWFQSSNVWRAFQSFWQLKMPTNSHNIL